MTDWGGNYRQERMKFPMPSDFAPDVWWFYIMAFVVFLIAFIIFTFFVIVVWRWIKMVRKEKSDPRKTQGN